MINELRNANIETSTVIGRMKLDVVKANFQPQRHVSWTVRNFKKGLIHHVKKESINH